VDDDDVVVLDDLHAGSRTMRAKRTRNVMRRE